MRVPGLGGANKEEVRGVLGVLVGYWCNTGCGGDAVGYSMRVWGEYGCAEGGTCTSRTPWRDPMAGQPPDGGYLFWHVDVALNVCSVHRGAGNEKRDGSIQAFHLGFPY